MKRKISLATLVIFFAAVLIPVMVGASSALANGGYAVNRWTVDNGGGSSQSGDGQYELSGTIGQWDANISSTGGEYTIHSGFWSMMKSILEEFLVNLPLVLR